MEKVYIIQWLDNDNENICMVGISCVCATLEKAKEELNRIQKEEQYRCEDYLKEIIKTDDYMKLIFDDEETNYIEYNIKEQEILK